MNKKIEFESICAYYRKDMNHIFYLNDDYDDDDDCVDTCLIWSEITFYGIPIGLSDDQESNIYEGDYSNAIKIAELMGCLILCTQIFDEGDDPLEVCDAAHGDLEYTVSALSDVGGPLNWEEGDPYQDIFYIHEIKMQENYNDLMLKSRIVSELPELVFRFFHVSPDILAYYPTPLDYTLDPSKLERYKALQNIALQKLDSALDTVELSKQDKGNVLNFGDNYKLSQDEINYLMRRRHSNSHYPEYAKDKKEFDFYRANGFVESGNSRLLYKNVTAD